MKVVLADVEEGALTKAAAEMSANGATVLAVQTDVRKAGDLEALAQATIKAFGQVNIVCNNAGVVPLSGPASWEQSLADWEWVLSVNLWGVIHGIRAFVPIMLSQDTECHIVNTASTMGFLPGTGSSAYSVSKHGVVTMSESLYHELAEAKSKIKVSVVCPGFVSTQLLYCDRNRPDELATDPSDDVTTPEIEAQREMAFKAVAGGTPPSGVADRVLEAIKDEQFYILTHAAWKPMIRSRMEDILEERNPTIVTSLDLVTHGGL
jgi:NAD(P)-dependent dehydrogenase (short-subunit alcohol dehydrogenase family)